MYDGARVFVEMPAPRSRTSCGPVRWDAGRGGGPPDEPASPAAERAGALMVAGVAVDLEALWHGCSGPTSRVEDSRDWRRRTEPYAHGQRRSRAPARRAGVGSRRGGGLRAVDLSARNQSRSDADPAASARVSPSTAAGVGAPGVATIQPASGPSSRNGVPCTSILRLRSPRHGPRGRDTAVPGHDQFLRPALVMTTYLQGAAPAAAAASCCSAALAGRTADDDFAGRVAGRGAPDGARPANQATAGFHAGVCPRRLRLRRLPLRRRRPNRRRWPAGTRPRRR
jgi:hypothetical protein